MSEKEGFRFLEHTADAYIEAYGKDMSEAFENAALAMFQVMTSINRISQAIEDIVEVKASDEQALLYSWLEALLVKFEVHRMLQSRFKILDFGKTETGFKLKARTWGEKFDPQKHTQKVGVKAVTYHRMEIIKHPDRVTLRFILDI